MQDVNYQDLFTKLDRVSGFAIINLLWVGSVLLVVAIPAATVGLFAVVSDWFDGKDSEALGRFFGAVRQHGIKATMIGLVEAGLFGLIALNIQVIPQMNLPTLVIYPFLAITLFMGLLAVMVNLYLWALIVRYDLTIKQLVNVAVRLTFLHFGWTLGLLVMVGGVLMMGLIVPALISVLILFSSCAYLITWGAWRIIQHYDADLCQMSA